MVRDTDFSRTLILTHHPVVDNDWFENFGRMLYDCPCFTYGSKSNGDNHASFEAKVKQGKYQYMYSASMQDLCGPELVNGNFNKSGEVFTTVRGCIIVNGAREGTRTELGKVVM